MYVMNFETEGGGRNGNQKSGGQKEQMEEGGLRANGRLTIHVER